MSAKQIGALIVMEGERLTGIFTECDALNKVLAAGLDPFMNGRRYAVAAPRREWCCRFPVAAVICEGDGA
jgi:hypothetical protein